MSPTRPALIAAVGVVLLLTSCSSSDDATPTTSTGESPSTMTSTATSTATSTVTAPSTTTANGVRIVALTGPRSPVDCNAPTSVELHFETQRAISVGLRINGGGLFATYPTGTHDELVPLECNGSPQRYQLTARGADGVTVSKTLTIETRMLAAS